VSIHNNFLSPAANPFKGNAHGYSVFYYHPHSLELARSVAAAYGRHVPLPSEELRFGDLLVCRLPAMPAILTESAYLTYPDQEALLLDASFRKRVAAAIVEGLRDFFRRERERQQP
jgi:N-acetylmuramoyl-L-alanine amidase